MSSKVIGALLILGAGGGLLVQLWRQSRAEILFLQDMASALEQMEAAIRFRRLPMPELLREQAERSYCGSMFSLILQHMERESLYRIPGSCPPDPYHGRRRRTRFALWNYPVMGNGSGKTCVPVPNPCMRY